MSASHRCSATSASWSPLTGVWSSSKHQARTMNAPSAQARAGDDAIAAWLRTLLGREVQQVALYRAALTHRSAQQDNNERLEFLGDAVLGMVIAEELFLRFPSGDEGDLSRLRARLVSSAPLAQIGADIGIGEMLHLG